MTTIADVSGGRDVKEQRRKSLDAEGRPTAARGGIKVVTEPALDIEVGADWACIEKLLISFFHDAVGYRALGLEHNPVHVCSSPAFTFPAKTAVTAKTAFELIEEEMIEHMFIVYGRAERNRG